MGFFFVGRITDGGRGWVWVWGGLDEGGWGFLRGFGLGWLRGKGGICGV